MTEKEIAVQKALGVYPRKYVVYVTATLTEAEPGTGIINTVALSKGGEVSKVTHMPGGGNTNVTHTIIKENFTVHAMYYGQLLPKLNTAVNEKYPQFNGTLEITALKHGTDHYDD